MIRRETMALATLAAACFVAVTSEYMPITALPQISSDLDVAEGLVGLLVSGYALVVAVTVVPLVVATGRWEPRTTLMIALGLVAISNLALSASPTFEVAIAARVLAAVGHGVFWSIVAPLAARIATGYSAGRATSIVFAGSSVATLAGLPATSAVAVSVGWRATAAGLGVGAALCLVAILVTVPPRVQSIAGEQDARAQVLPNLRHPGLTGVTLATLVVVFAHFVTYTYVTIFMSRLAGASESGVSVLLLVSGIVGLTALLAAGRLVDRRPRGIAVTVAGGTALCLGALLALGHGSEGVSTVAIVAWAVPAALMPTVLQAAVLRTRPPRPEIATAIYVVVYQIGIGAGALVGGTVLETSLDGVLIVGLVGATIGVLVILRTAAFPSIASDPEPPSHATTERKSP